MNEANKNKVQLFNRDNGEAPWAYNNATVNTTAKTFMLTGLTGEYVMGISNLQVAIKDGLDAKVCFGKNTTIVANGQKGQAPYLYRLNNSDPFTANNKFTAGPGRYVVSVQDAHNHITTSESITISEPTVAISLGVHTADANCSGTTGGIITLIPQGGFGPYTYNINGSSFVPDSQFNALAAGSYKVVAKDIAGCTVAKNVIIKASTVGCADLVASSSVVEASAQKIAFNVTVKPNPSRSEFVVAVSGTDNNTKTAIKVVDMQGRTLYQNVGASLQEYRFGRNFAAGMYIAEILNGKTVQRIKLIKSN